MAEDMTLNKARRWAEIQQEADQLLKDIKTEYDAQMREYKATKNGMTRMIIERLADASTAAGSMRDAFGRLYQLYMNNGPVITYVDFEE